MRISPLTCRAGRTLALAALLVLVAGPIVQWSAISHAGSEAPPGQNQSPVSKTQHGPYGEPLPPQVVEMRQAILDAAASGRIEELLTPIEWNEMRPEMGAPAGEDPITYLKRISADGEGREILAILANILAAGPARLPIGQDPENNAVFVWPYLSELPLDSLHPADEVALLRLMPADKARALRQGKRWTWWRLAIGADGTWHTFLRRD